MRELVVLFGDRITPYIDYLERAAHKKLHTLALRLFFIRFLLDIYIFSEPNLFPGMFLTFFI